ncbi:MAG: universal stress protein [Gemmatimonadota bacterium]
MGRSPHPILAATDLGDGSDDVVRSAAFLAHATGADLYLIHSLDLPWTPSDDVMRRSGLFGQITSSEERLEEQARRTMPQGMRPAGQEVILHVAHQAIVARARDLGADLIVVGPHRGGGVGAHFLGTTADRVIRAADVPCLVARGAFEGGIHRVGVALDHSEPAGDALDAAMALGARLSEPDDPDRAGRPSLHVMHAGWSVEEIDDPGLEERVIRPELATHVERARANIPGAEGIPVEIEVLWANEPAACIVAWAAKREMDLLVLGTRSKNRLQRALIGSVASRVARRAGCPVLLVPPIAAAPDGASG